MGRILGYVVLLGNLSLIVRGLDRGESLPPSHHEPETRQNGTNFSTVGHQLQKNDTFSKRIGEEILELRPPVQPGAKPKPNDMPKTPGLSSFMAEPQVTSKRRTYNLGHSRRGYDNPSRYYRGPPPPPPPSLKRGYISPYSQKLLPAKNYNQLRDTTGTAGISSEGKSFGHPTAQGTHNFNTYQRYYHNSGRNSRYYHQRENSKVCNSCNSVPWVPLLEVPASYRKERNQHFASSNHHTQHESPNYNNYDYHAVSSDTHNFVLSSSPLVPPAPTILDGTISSSFGLPVGNIPTGHGLLAPLNHFLSPPTPDYTTAATFFSPPSLLDGSPIPELSPVPIVPVYDSGQFYTGPLLDSADIGLVPPTMNSLSVSNVVFTISEGNQINEHHTVPEKDHVNSNNDKINFKQNAVATSESGTHVLSAGSQPQKQSHSEQHPRLVPPPPQPPSPGSQMQPPPQQSKPHPPSQPQQHLQQQQQQQQQKQQQQQTAIHRPQIQNFGGIEIVKSVPLAEFTTGSAPTVKPNHLGGPIQNQINYQNINGGSGISSGVASSTSTISGHSGSDHFQQDLKSLENNPSNYLVPPPKPPEFNGSFNVLANSVYNDVRHSENQFQTSFQDSAPKPLASSAASWVFSNSETDAKGTNLKPPQPLITESQQIASIVNSEFRPIPSQVLPISQGTDGVKSKKVQIIIPYTTKPKNDLDTNSFESVRHEVFQTLQSLSNKSQQEYAAKFERINPNALELNKTSAYNRNNSNVTGTNHRQQEVDRFKNPKYVAEMQHILAKNIKELLYREIEKSPVKQNYPLQNNIDNWTALEYSNHQTTAPKQPKEIISQALSVTSIPGTSISHTLLPSKKIPAEYFVSTAPPLFDNSLSTWFKVTNATVYSRPFTPRPQTTVSNTSNTFVKLSSPSPFTKRQNETKAWNYGNNYTVVSKSRVNYWGKLNENLVAPEKTHYETTALATSTPSSHSFFLKTDKVDIVTPVSVTTRKMEPTRRTTRHVRVTERTLFKRNQTRPFPPRLKLPPPSIKALNATANHSKTANPTPSSLTNNFAELKKLQIRAGVHKRVKNQTEVNRTNSSVGKNQTVVTRSNTSETFNRNETTTTTKTTTTTTTTTTTSTQTPIAAASSIIAASNVTVKTNQSEEVSINDIIPFRNQVLPWGDMGPDATAESDSRQNATRQRKSLIKQVKSRRPKRGVSEVVHSLRPHSIRRNSELGT